MPARELADGALILIGGTLMLAPGFVTDGFGILMILPFTRPFFRRAADPGRVEPPGGAGPGRPARAGRRGFSGGGDARRPGPDPEGPVIRGEVVDE